MLSKLRNCKPEYLTFAVCLNRAAKTTSLLVGPSEKSREQPAMTTRVANQNTGFTSFCPLREGEGGGVGSASHMTNTFWGSAHPLLPYANILPYVRSVTVG